MESLGRGEVHLFTASPPEIDDVGLAELAALMSDDERARHRAFVREANRREFVVTRALVRRALSLYRGVEPAAWRFRAGARGRPAIDPPCGLVFNVANHPSMVVCAVAEGMDVGVDVEPLARGDEILEVARTVFSPQELAELSALGPAAQRDRAVALWTSKEAYVKARGEGLAIPLGSFSFSFTSSSSSAFAFASSAPRVAFDAALGDDPARWDFRLIDVDGHRVALAVATDGPPAMVRVRRGIAPGTRAITP